MADTDQRGTRIDLCVGAARVVDAVLDDLAEQVPHKTERELVRKWRKSLGEFNAFG